MAVENFFKIVKPKPDNIESLDNQNMTDAQGLYGNYSWYNRVVQGSGTRISRYKEYDLMDADTDIARALDIITEEILGNISKKSTPLYLSYESNIDDNIDAKRVKTHKAALKTWCNIQKWNNRRLYNFIRNTLKYGDTFFRKYPEKPGKKWNYIHPKNVVSAISSIEDITEVRGWNIKSEMKAGTGTLGYSMAYNVGTDMSQEYTDTYKNSEIVRFSILDDTSEEAPFGISILRDIYKTFKKKELLEDSVLIFRIQRAPEKRVYKIEMGSIRADQRKAVLENIRREIKQKKVPTNQGGGQQSVESIYNPQSMSEDFFFAQNDGKGSSMDVVGGNMEVGNLEDLAYFFKKMWRGLRIPESYISNTLEGSKPYDSGKVGIAYLQEVKFAEHIERLQSYFEEILDWEFKQFCRSLGIKVDNGSFHVRLPPPSDFATSRKQQIEQELLNNYSSASGIEHMSTRFALKKYLQLSDDEIAENERMMAEEMGLNPDKDDPRKMVQIYNPEMAEKGGFDGGIGGGFDDSPANELPDEDLNLDDIGDSGEEENNEDQEENNEQ